MSFPFAYQGGLGLIGGKASYTLDVLIVGAGGGGGVTGTSTQPGTGGGGGGHVVTGSQNAVHGITTLTVTVGIQPGQSTGPLQGASSSVTGYAVAPGGFCGAQASGDQAGNGGNSGAGYLGGAHAYGAAGGGAASTAGGAASGDGHIGGSGANGVNADHSGAARWYGSGGGGCGFSSPGIGGGEAGNGARRNGSGAPATAPTNYGCGGGGGAWADDTTTYRGNTPGFQGVVIIRYAGSQQGTGGTVSSSGGNTIHTFTTSGTFTA